MIFLQNLNTEVNQAGGALDEQRQKSVVKAYRKILREAENRCPAPPESE